MHAKDAFPFPKETVRGEITKLLAAWNHGDPDALDELMSAVYEELKGEARRHLSGEREALTLTPTALIHETFLKLVEAKKMTLQNRAQFFWFTGQLMRRIIIEHARARGRQKRGGPGRSELSLEQVREQPHGNAPCVATILTLDEALTQLERIDPRQCRIIELRFFMGLSVREIADVMSISPITVKREWRTAKHWLSRQLQLMARD